MAHPSLHGLPAELQLAIAELIHRPSDLKNLCLTCKSLRDAAVPKLYRKVDFNLDQCTFAKLNGYFMPTNPGPTYVRSLNFDPDTPKDSKDAIKVMRLALQLVPRNGLRTMMMPREMLLDEGLFMQLCVEQRRLSFVALGMIGSTVAGVLASPAFPGDWLESITSLSVPNMINDLHDLEGYRQLIERAPRLAGLRIRTNKVATQTDTKFLEDKSDAEGQLFPALFSHVLGSAPQPKIKLSQLALICVSVRHPMRTLMRVIDFSGLTHLVLNYCKHSTELLLALTNHFKTVGSALRRFELEAWVTDVSVVEDFLKATSGLFCVHIICSSSRQNRPFDISSLSTHFATVSQLALTFRIGGWGAGIPLTAHTYEVIGKDLPKLKDVAIAMPVVRSASSGHDESGDFDAALAAVCRNPRLETIRFTTWPLANADDFPSNESVDNLPEIKKQLETLAMVQYLRRLDSFANGLLRRFATSRGTFDPSSLPLLSFGETMYQTRVEESGSEAYMEVESVTYIPTLQRAAFGGQEIVGLRIEGRGMRYYIPYPGAWEYCLY